MRDVPQPTVGAWIPYEVPLIAADFQLNSVRGPLASDAQFLAVMTNLTSIRISAEFGSEKGEETVDIDSIIMVSACPADLNGDGAVNGADLLILLGALGGVLSVW